MTWLSTLLKFNKWLNILCNVPLALKFTAVNKTEGATDSLNLLRFWVPSSVRFLEPVVFVLQRGSCFGAFLEGGLIVSPRAQYKNTFIFYVFWQCQLTGFLHCCEPSSRQHLNLTQREGRLDGKGDGWADGWMCVIWKYFHCIPLTAAACCQPAALRRGRDETLPSLNKNHVTELLFLKWAKSDALTCDSYSTVDGDIYWVKYNFIKSAMLLQFCISFVFSSI